MPLKLPSIPTIRNMVTAQCVICTTLCSATCRVAETTRLPQAAKRGLLDRERLMHRSFRELIACAPGDTRSVSLTLDADRGNPCSAVQTHHRHACYCRKGRTCLTYSMSPDAEANASLSAGPMHDSAAPMFAAWADLLSFDLRVT